MNNSTDAGKPSLTPEDLKAAGLNEKATPDLLVEGRIWDVYTPYAQASAYTVVSGIQAKIEKGQTYRVVVDLRATMLTRAQVMAAATGDYRLRGVRELMFFTNDGLGEPFVP